MLRINQLTDKACRVRGSNINFSPRGKFWFSMCSSSRLLRFSRPSTTLIWLPPMCLELSHYITSWSLFFFFILKSIFRCNKSSFCVNLQFFQGCQVSQIRQSFYSIILYVQMGQIGSKFEVVDFCQTIIVQINYCQSLANLINNDLIDLLVLIVNMSKSIQIVVYWLISPTLLTGTGFGNRING